MKSPISIQIHDIVWCIHCSWGAHFSIWAFFFYIFFLLVWLQEQGLCFVSQTGCVLMTCDSSCHLFITDPQINLSVSLLLLCLTSQPLRSKLIIIIVIIIIIFLICGHYSDISSHRTHVCSYLSCHNIQYIQPFVLNVAGTQIKIKVEKQVSAQMTLSGHKHSLLLVQRPRTEL